MKHSIFLLGAASGAVALAAGAASAAVTASLTDQASVEASLASFTVEDFESAAVGNLNQAVPAVFNGFTVTANGTSGFASDFSIGDLDTQTLNLFAEDVNIPSFEFTFDSPVDTFAASLFSPQSADGLVFTFSTGDVVTTQSIGGLNGTGANYVSFVSDTPFTSLTISSTFEAVRIDNVVAGLIPAPGAAGLLGFAALASARRRRH